MRSPSDCFASLDYDPMCGLRTIEALTAFEKCIIGVAANPSNRANNENQNNGQHHGLFGDVLTLVFIPQFLE